MRIRTTPVLPVQTVRRTAKRQAIANLGTGRAAALPELFAGLKADKARVKYGCLKALRAISEEQPEVLYPEFDRIAALLDIESVILRWGAIIIIGNLAAVDTEEKIGPMLERYLAPIAGKVMITAANTVGGAGKIARAKPRFADRIVRVQLQVESATYQTPECRNVALGHVVKSLDLFFEHISDPKPVMAFVQRQLNNSRNAVKKKAAAFLKKHKACLSEKERGELAAKVAGS
jgi:hypothetical protein